jgi:PPOX class probable F420-dependent enzyme
MPSRRAQIQMSEPELIEFLQEQWVVTVATMGARGRPHLMPLWYVPEGLEIVVWTYAASQKVKNLERDPRATLQVEAGERYSDLRGVMLECDAEIQRDSDRVKDAGLAVFTRYSDTGTLSEAETQAVAKQSSKRVGLRFAPTRIVSWDHRKLEGRY